MKLFKLIKKYREDNSLTMEQFASLCSLSKGYISMLEKNENPQTKKPIIPSLVSLKKISKAMNIDFNEFLDVLDNQKVSLLNNDEEIISSLKTEQEENLLTDFRKLNATGKIKAAEYISDLTDTEKYTVLDNEDKAQDVG